MRILVGILAHQLSGDTLARVHRMRAIDHAGHDIMCMWGQDWRPGETRFEAVTRKYEDLRRIFVGGPWDVLMTVEQDMLVPDDALTKLAQVIADGADVAYGLYVWRYAKQHWWSAHPQVRLVDGEARFWSLTHQPTEARRLWGQLVRVEGLGLGCTMINRRVLTALPFRAAHGHSNDTMLAIDVRDAGMTQVADLSVACGHALDDHRAIWPDPSTDELYTMKEID